MTIKMTTTNNKRIAKNTLLLYIRMFLSMGVSLFTVRIVLDTLGTVDYGIYNVVAGVVTMFSFLSGSLSTASQRYFSFELGKNNLAQLKKTFSMTFTIYVLIGVIILILTETVGLWFLNHKMTIPPERINAANWVFQFSILAFIMTMFTIPYNASIIAHEKMSVFAWMSIIEVTLKLLIVYLLLFFDFDKLKLYAILTFTVTTLVTFGYRTYCIRNFEECKLKYKWDAKLFKELAGFSGWNLFGSIAFVIKNQGINILLNVFFDPVVNAARGIAFQINNAIYMFINSFTTAVKPQIIKYYAQDEKTEMNKLVFQSSKFSYFLLFILSLPLLIETNLFLGIWLKRIPPYVLIFTRLVVINALIDSLTGPLVISALATGKIKKYQIIVGGTMIMTLPLSHMILSLGYPPESTMYVSIFIAAVNLFLRLILLQHMTGLNLKFYINEVLSKVILSSFIALAVPLWLKYKTDTNTINFFVIVFCCLVISPLAIYFTGLSDADRFFFKSILQRKFLKFRTTAKRLS